MRKRVRGAILRSGIARCDAARAEAAVATTLGLRSGAAFGEAGDRGTAQRLRNSATAAPATAWPAFVR